MDYEDDDDRPSARDDFRPWLLQELKKESGLDTDELGLFELYEREHARTIEEMLRVEREVVKESRTPASTFRTTAATSLSSTTSSGFAIPTSSTWRRS
jgi:hypothetical protein